MPRSPPLSYGDGWITGNPLGPSQERDLKYWSLELGWKAYFSSLCHCADSLPFSCYHTHTCWDSRIGYGIVYTYFHIHWHRRRKAVSKHDTNILHCSSLQPWRGAHNEPRRGLNTTTRRRHWVLGTCVDILTRLLVLLCTSLPFPLLVVSRTVSVRIVNAKQQGVVMTSYIRDDVKLAQLTRARDCQS